MTGLTRFALVAGTSTSPAWLSAESFDAVVELAADDETVASLDALARRWPGGFLRVAAGPEGRAAAYRYVLALPGDAPAPAGDLVVLDWPDPAGESTARPAVVGVDLDWLPARSLGGGRDCFPSGPAGAGTSPEHAAGG